MNVSFVLLIVASVILRHVAIEARTAFLVRVVKLLPRKVTASHLQALFDEYRQLLPAFRSQALPLAALECSLNTVAGAVFIAGLWTYPPRELSDTALFLLRYCGAAFVLLAVLGDLFAFGRLFYFSFSRVEAEDDEEAEETGEA